jgi:hypothetical protein
MTANPAARMPNGLLWSEPGLTSQSFTLLPSIPAQPVIVTEASFVKRPNPVND